MGTTVDQLHAWAKRAIKTGEACCFREVAGYLLGARTLGATQRQSADAIGKSAGWVNRLLKWRDGGCKDTPFGPQSKVKRERGRVQAPEQKTPLATAQEHSQAQTAKWDAARAKAELQRAELVAALETLPPDHPVEQVRARIGLTWAELVVAAEQSEVAVLH
jgi:hypothetical protein